jgi:cell division septation protein DedD
MVLNPKNRREDSPSVSEEEFEELPERSIFSTWWFRGLLVLVILAVVAIIAVPYVLDWWTPTAPPRSAAVKPQIPPPPPPLPTQAAQHKEAPPPSPAPSPAKSETAKPSLVPPPSKADTGAASTVPPRVEAKASVKAEAKLPPAPRERATAKVGIPAAKAAVDGAYWVQVGAFKDQNRAAQLVAKLTGENYPAQESSLERPAGGSHNVFVTGASAEEVSGKLPGKRYRAEKAGAEVVIQPALPMAEAVNLSKQLARHGLVVKIRRASATQTFHVVRVGAYADRQRADSVRKELEGKGMAGFLVRDEKR